MTSWIARSTSPRCSRNRRSAATDAGGSGPTPWSARWRASRTNAPVSAGAASLKRGASLVPTVDRTLTPRSYGGPGEDAVASGCGIGDRYGDGVPAPVPPSPWDFGDPSRYDELDDLVAIGADLAPGTLVAAYRRGLFPMPSGPPGGPPAGSARSSAASCPWTACG